MTTDIDSSLEIVKNGVLSLRPSGADGFEGLLRIVLTDLLDIPFRLAASGLQGGMDGDAVMQSDHVCFEAKRYSTNIHRNEVLAKIADLSRRKEIADRLWILGATIEVNTQLATAVQESGDLNAISTFILDWTAAPLPLLAIVVVAAGDTAVNFIVNNYHDKTGQRKPTEDELKGAFSSISRHPEFGKLLQRLKSNLNVSTLSLKRAVDLNIEWRKQTLGSTRMARERLGQGVAVLEDSAFPAMREELRISIASEIRVSKVVVLLGDEGHGKSWLSAQLYSNAEGLAIFVSAEQFEGVSIEDLDDLLIELLIKQTGDIPNDTHKYRWRHRLRAWRTERPLNSLLVVVDGLNQRQSIRWDKLLNGIQSRLDEIGGSILATVRPHLWKKVISRGLAFKPSVIKVPEWSPKERNQLLQYHGISLDWLDPKTLKTLQNPRLLNVAVTTLPHRKAIAWKGLTIDRLLMEHLRRSQLENYEDETFENLTQRLSMHATKVLERVQTSSSETPQNFQADSNAVIETRFFRPLPGPGDHYELRDEGLTLALGFTLVDQLWQALRAKQDLSERVVQLVEPINAMDRTADVVFSSLLICALDDIRFDTGIFSALLDAFANIQNVNDRRFEEFVAIAEHQPKAFFDTLRNLCLERGYRVNQDWFVHAAFELASSEAGWQTAETAIHQWLHCYNKNPAVQTNRYQKQSDSDYEKRLEDKKSEIGEVLASLSAFEKQLLDRMTEVQTELDELFTLALRLLAGRSLVGFADSFIAMGLAFALDTSMYTAHKAFRQLTTFNQLERDATRNSFLKAIEPLRKQCTSKGGQWTVVRMLYSTGAEVDSIAAGELAEELREHWFNPGPQAPDKWQQAKVANPDAKRPVDINEGEKEFIALDPEKILQAMWVGSEDHSFTNFLPVACRFNPVVAIEKTQAILTGLLTRKGMPLRQLILNGAEHLPLIDPDLAKGLVDRVANSDAFDTLPEQDQLICRMFAFYCAAHQLSAAEQLKCVTSKAFGTDFLSSAIPSLKRQSTEGVIAAVEDALQNSDEDVAYGVLTVASLGGTKINDKLEKHILACSFGESSKLRAVAFELATQRNLDLVRHSHTYSNWEASSADENTYESWFGSMLLVEACVRGEISIKNLLSRISPKVWFTSLDKLGTDLTKPLVDMFLQRLRQGIVAAGKIQLPVADFKLSRTDSVPFQVLSIEETDRESERFPPPKDLRDVLGAVNDFDEKQSKLKVVARAFFETLKKSDAKLLVREVAIDELQNLLVEVPALLDELVAILDRAESSQFIWLKNLAFAVANLISEKSPEKAVELLNRTSASPGFVTLSLGDDLTLEHQAIWGSQASKAMETLWRRRILSSKNNAVLAREVLAAERFGAKDYINHLAQELVSSDDSLKQAYGISIAGYMLPSDNHARVVNKFINNRGLPGDAAKHSITEHENALWARQWVEKMWNAATSEEFWRCLMIAKTSMDARVDAHPPDNSIWLHYVPVFNKARKTALKDRNKEREKWLIGQAAPDPIFINHT